MRGFEDLLAELYDGAWQEDLGRYRLGCAYRGCSADDTLRTGLSRMGGAYWRVEPVMLRAFRKYARDHLDLRTFEDNDWSWMAIAQHHALPTRLLDWTHSPLVALHFASEHEREGAIWRVDYRLLNRSLPRKLRRALEREEADVFTAELLGEVAPRMGDLERLSREPFALFFEPPSLDARIVNQFALFSLMSSPRAQLADFLDAHRAAVRKIIVPRDTVRQVRDYLDQSNVTERVLFPGLDGLSRYLRRYYTPRAPVRS